MVPKRVGTLLVLLVLTSAPVWAQYLPSHLTGTVKDAQGAVLPGVTVTATSPALIGTETVVTGSNGAYQFPNLPAGTYALKFELQGFQTFTRSSIVLSLNQTLTVDAALQVASLKENVTVTAESPVVDTQSTTISNTFDSAKLTGVPSSTDLWAALAQAPGVRMQGFDVGGSHKSQQSGYSAFGENSQARVITEGVDQTEGTSGAGFYQDYFSQNEIIVSGAGQDVSMNAPGALVMATIKSGGNDFKSLINQTYEPGSFVGNNADSADAARGGSAQPNLVFWENHDDIGGPIRRDRLWFFAAFNYFKINKQVSGVPIATATDLGLFDNFTTKETYKMSSKDTLIGYYQWGKKRKPLRGIGVTTPPESALAQDSDSWDYNGKWDRVWSNRMFTELNVGEFGYDFPEIPTVPYANNPPRYDLATGYSSGAGFVGGGTTGPFDLERAKPQVYGNITYYLPTKSTGSHDLKFGFEWLNDMETDASIGTSGPLLYLDNGGKPSEIRLTDLGDPTKLGSTWQTPVDGNKRQAYYVQDRWAMNSKVSVTAGLRDDVQSPYYTASSRSPVLSDIFSSYSTAAKTFFTVSNLAWRLGVTVDPKGDGKTAIKGFYGRYYFNYAQSFSVADPGGANTKTYVFNDLNGNGLYDGPQELGALLSSTGGVSTTISPTLTTPYTDEVDLSFQRQFLGESSFRILYVRKVNQDQLETYNSLWQNQFTVPVAESVTIQNFDTGVQGKQTFTVNDVPNSLKGKVANVIGNIDQPGAYNTIELAFDKRFQKGLFIDASYDWTHGNDFLNPNSNSNSNLTQSDPIGNSYYENPYPTVSNVQNTTTWVVHLSSRYELPYQIGIGANFLVQSGWNYARIISVSLPNAGVQRFWMEDVSNNRSDNVPLLNFRVDKGFSFGRYRLTGMLDIFNLTNANPVVNFNLVNGSKFDQINGLLDPRTLQLGIRFEF